MRTIRILLLSIAIVYSLSNNAQELSRWGFELSGGTSVAVGKLADASTKLGGGFEGIFHYRFMPHAGFYGGWGWNSVSAQNSFLGNNVSFEETGYVFGLQFKHPIAQSAVSYFVRLGGLYNHIETENAAGSIIHDTKHGLGFQSYLGLDIPLGVKWSLTPSVKFNSLSRSIQPIEGINEMHLNYLSLRIGILKRF